MSAVPLLIAHMLLNIATLSGGREFGALDTVIILWLAFRLAGRFPISDGRPGSIGPSLMIGTMLIAPLVAVGYAIVSHLPPARGYAMLNGISEIVGLANLLLIIRRGLCARLRSR